MKRIHKILVGLFVALAVAIPLVFAATATNAPERPAVVRVATEPTPTPTRTNGQPCPGTGC